MKRDSYVSTWFRHYWIILTREMHDIVTDSGAMLIFIVAGLIYPLMYCGIYSIGLLDKAPMAIVDESDSPESREFIRELDATRECKIQAKCLTVDEARKLMEKGKVHGIIYFPRDFGHRMVRGEKSYIYIYADMSSFLYYKDAMMGVNMVMLDQVRNIQIERYEAKGVVGEDALQQVRPILYEENFPFNRAFSYQIFICTAILLVIMQQSMFYGLSLIAGTQREEHRSYARLVSNRYGLGVGRILLGKGTAYGLIYLGLTIYAMTIVPAIFNLPQFARFRDLLLLAVLFVIACVFFCEFWSTFVTRRETVFILFLFISPICLFLTGFSWPWYNMPGFYKVASYVFPTTFGVQTFMNLNCAGATLETCADSYRILVVQAIVYCLLATVATYWENWVIRHKQELIEAREARMRRSGIDPEENVRIIGGDEAVEEYRKKKGLKK